MILSYQLYSSRNHSDLQSTCDLLQALGYQAVEPFGALFADLDALERAIKDAGLLCPTAHVGLADLEANPKRILDLSQRLGIKSVYVPYLLPDERPNDAAGWREFGARLVNAGGPLRDLGLGFGWHNHDFEFIATPDGAIPMDAIFEGGPDLDWEADIAWIIRGGADPFEWIKTHGDRITSVHVKDIAPAGEKADEDGWADPGTGTVDWAALHQALQSTRASVYVMEHDNPSDDTRFAAAGRDLFRALDA